MPQENKVITVDLLDIHQRLSALEDMLWVKKDPRSKIIQPMLQLLEDLHKEIKPVKPAGVSDFQFRDDQLQSTLKSLGEILKMAVPKDVRYVLLLSRTGEGGGLFYASTLERGNALEVMQEFIEKNK